MSDDAIGWLSEDGDDAVIQLHGDRHPDEGLNCRKGRPFSRDGEIAVCSAVCYAKGIWTIPKYRVIDNDYVYEMRARQELGESSLDLEHHERVAWIRARACKLEEAQEDQDLLCKPIPQTRVLRLRLALVVD